jgi:beta-glucosidase-like glycosyl hydrolase
MFLSASLPPFHEYFPAAQKKLEQLSLEQKIGQIFMMKISYKKSLEDYKQFIDAYNIGGIFLHGGTTIGKQIDIVNTLQAHRSLPILVGQNLEWGLNMRFQDNIEFPYALTLGAIQNNSLLYHLGAAIGRQCKMVGVHLNTAPIMDINTNPNNPGFRSFGDTKENVTEKAVAFIQGLQNNHILACAKHFPGQGDTEDDSHKKLPRVNHSQERLQEIELYPFKEAIKAGVTSIMSGHLMVAAWDSEKPATLSRPIITNLLKKQLDFKGLCITDSLTMKAISKNYTPLQANIQAFLVGNDILLYAQDIPETIATLTNLITANSLLAEQLNKSVLKIIAAKEWVKKHNPLQLVPLSTEDIYTLPDLALKKKLYKGAITIINNENGQIPLTKEYFALLYCSNPFKTFQDICLAHINHILTAHLATPKEQDDFLCNGANNNRPCVCAIETTPRGITDENFINFVNNLHEKKYPVIALLFGNPYTLKKLQPGIPTIIAYENDPDAQEAAAHVLLGKERALGKLPITI